MIITICRDDPELVECPRCWRWHGAKHNLNWPIEGRETDPERQVICDRCAEVLLTDHPGHEISVAIRANRDWQRREQPWRNRLTSPTEPASIAP